MSVFKGPCRILVVSILEINTTLRFAFVWESLPHPVEIMTIDYEQSLFLLSDS